MALGGAALVLGFVLLQNQRARGYVVAGALQGWIAALAVALHGWVHGEPRLSLAAAATLAVNGVLLPRALAGMAKPPGAAEPALGAAESMLLGLLLVVVAVLAVQPAIRDGELMTENLAVALSVMLLGLGVMIVWRNPLICAVGLLSLGNGLILGIGTLPGMTIAMELTVAVLAMGTLAVLGLSYRVRERDG